MFVINFSLIPSHLLPVLFHFIQSCSLSCYRNSSISSCFPTSYISHCTSLAVFWHILFKAHLINTEFLYTFVRLHPSSGVTLRVSLSVYLSVCHYDILVGLCWTRRRNWARRVASVLLSVTWLFYCSSSLAFL